MLPGQTERWLTGRDEKGARVDRDGALGAGTAMEQDEAIVK